MCVREKERLCIYVMTYFMKIWQNAFACNLFMQHKRPKTLKVIEQKVIIGLVPGFFTDASLLTPQGFLCCNTIIGHWGELASRLSLPHRILNLH